MSPLTSGAWGPASEAFTLASQSAEGASNGILTQPTSVFLALPCSPCLALRKVLECAATLLR